VCGFPHASGAGSEGVLRPAHFGVSETENAVITITTVYYGADPETVAGFVTTPLENAIAQANGIDYLSSNSRSGTSTITANLVLNFDPDKAITEITAKINSVLNQLPAGVQQPTLTVAIGQSLDALIIGFSSDELSPNQITDYLIRNVQPRLQAVPGVQTAELLVGRILHYEPGSIRRNWPPMG